MRILNAKQLNEYLNCHGWASVIDGRIAASISTIQYTGNFEPHGIVGSDLAHIFLNELSPGPIKSGVLQIVGICPNSSDQTAIISYMSLTAGFDTPKLPPIRLRFDDNYYGLVAMMSWSLACGWQWDFIADDHDYIVSAGSDETVSVVWNSGMTLTRKMTELLSNMKFMPVA